jgi:hypothetical protein
MNNPMTVLVIEDNPSFRRSLTASRSQSGGALERAIERALTLPR